MYIKSVKLKNFRNYEDLYIDGFSENINVIGGKNAQGKTNFLEALVLCADGKSFRVSKDSFLINDKKDNAYVKVTYEDKGIERNIEILLSRDKKKAVKINGEAAKKIKELYGKLCIVVFSPEDLKIIREAPGLRRKFLDIEISRIRPSYIDALKNYQKILLEKNAALKKDADKNVIDVYNEAMAAYISLIRKNRKLYCDKLNEYANKALKKMGAEEKIEFEFIPSVSQEDILSELSGVFEREVKERQCVKGPQRDEIAIKINGKEAKFFASQGQTRTIMLAMKIAAVYIAHEWTDKISVLLLDDVFSELDRNRKNWIVKTVKNIQTFITTANESEALKIGGNIYTVEKGNIKRHFFNE